jgi:hypothetical protein
VAAVGCAISVEKTFDGIAAKSDDLFQSSAEALAEVGSQSDVAGVAVCGTDSAHCGNYFYLRKNVPLYVDTDIQLVHWKVASDPHINYLVTQPDSILEFDGWRPRALKRCGIFVVYRLSRSGATERRRAPASE